MCEVRAYNKQKVEVLEVKLPTTLDLPILIYPTYYSEFLGGKIQLKE